MTTYNRYFLFTNKEEFERVNKQAMQWGYNWVDKIPTYSEIRNNLPNIKRYCVNGYYNNLNGKMELQYNSARHYGIYGRGDKN